MARRGKNSIDQGRAKHNFDGKEGEVFNKENFMNDSFSGRSQSPNGSKLKKNKSSVTSKKSSAGSANATGREKSEDVASHTNFPSSDSSRKSEDQFEGNIDLGNSGTGIANAGSLLNATRWLDALMGGNMRALAVHVLKVANGWIEKQKPQIGTFMTVIGDVYNYVSIRTKIAYPVLRTWILHAGKIMFLLSMVWLNCSVRGLYSLVHLGTTSFFAVLWCSFLSLLAMIGITKMLILLVLAGLVAVFVGLALAVIVITFTAAIILWIYGSFWTTGLLIAVGGTAFALRHERVALLLTTVYSTYCAKSYVGWSGLLLGFSLSFISSDLLIYMLKKHANDPRFNTPSEQERQSHSRSNNFYTESMHVPPAEDMFGSAFVRSADHDSGAVSTSGADAELTSENEVARLLNCNDHYSALGFARYENIDASSIKREYRKKAMLVHPDKNMGNEKAVEAFKKLQNAYEVLLDSLKRKTYDDELRREEILSYFRRFQGVSQKNAGHGLFSPGFGHYGLDDEGLHGDARRIACKKCKDFHTWICTERSKSRARYCQDCKDFHQAKDGDGWVEQSSQPVIFGLMQKMDPPHAYVCAESRIYDVTTWFTCQGMKCPANTHKPSFHVNTSLASKYNGKGSASSSNGVDGGMPMPDIDDTMTGDEFFEWLQNAMQSGIFDSNDTSNENPSPRTSTPGKSNSNKKKRKGKKHW